MLKFKNIIVVLVFFLFGVCWSQEDILKKSDESYFPKIAEFKLTMKLYENNTYQNYYELKCFVKGNRKYLAIFKNPPIVRKQAYLRVENNIWQYLGKIKRTIRLSAKANFSGSAFSEEDVLSSSLGYFYTLNDVSEVVIDGRKALKLNLVTNSDENAYARIEAFIDPDTYVPIKRYYYSYSDQKIKELFIKDIKRNNNKLSYAHIIMYDLLRDGKYTEIIFDDIRHREDLPDRMFTKKYMELASE